MLHFLQDKEVTYEHFLWPQFSAVSIFRASVFREPDYLFV